MKLMGWDIAPGKHRCDTPPLGLPGDEWECPVCQQVWWADDLERIEGVFIEWRRK